MTKTTTTKPSQIAKVIPSLDATRISAAASAAAQRAKNDRSNDAPHGNDRP
jgi:hypothetical protein